MAPARFRSCSRARCLNTAEDPVFLLHSDRLILNMLYDLLVCLDPV